MFIVLEYMHIKISVLGHKRPFLVWSQTSGSHTSWSQKGGHKRGEQAVGNRTWIYMVNASPEYEVVPVNTLVAEETVTTCQTPGRSFSATQTAHSALRVTDLSGTQPVQQTLPSLPAITRPQGT